MTKFEVGKEYKFGANSNVACKCVYTSESQAVLKTPLGYIFIPQRPSLWKEVKKRGDIWVNIYETSKGKPAIHGHATKSEADFHGEGARIACVKLSWEEGQEL